MTDDEKGRKEKKRERKRWEKRGADSLGMRKRVKLSYPHSYQFCFTIATVLAQCFNIRILFEKTDFSRCYLS